MTNYHNIVGMSGGKDSTATALLSIERKADPVIYLFADTHNEHDITYEYLVYLEQKLDINIKRVSAEYTDDDFARRRDSVRKTWGKKRKNRKKLKDSKGKHLRDGDGGYIFGETPAIPDDLIEEVCTHLYKTGNVFLDMCLLHGTFPASARKFCSIELKQTPMLDNVVQPILDEGGTVISWLGVRAQESHARKHLDIVDEEQDNLIIYRPLITWKHEDVFALAKRYGVKNNPLYEKGMGRVGCMPCINCGKSEISQIALRFPEVIDRIRAWEIAVNKVNRYHTAVGREAVPSFFTRYEKGLPVSVDRVVDWSKTTHGGQQLDILKTKAVDLDSCAAVYPVVCE